MRKLIAVAACGAFINLLISCLGSVAAEAAVRGPATVNPYVIEAVTCVSAKDCWAVGLDRGPTFNRALVEHWTGKKWSRSASPRLAQNSVLTAVTCFGPRECWAVGNDQTHAVIEHWSGKKWSVSHQSATGSFYAVACPSAKDCVAVGGGAANGTSNQKTLAERWNGSKWSVLRSPSVPAPLDQLLGLSCTSTKNCIAVGNWLDVLKDVGGTLTEKWNGSGWSLETTSTASDFGFVLSGVSCHSVSDCTAAGIGSDQPLAVHWNGTKWELQSAVPQAKGGNFYSVSCPAVSQCTAVGTHGGSGRPQGTLPLVQHWDHGEWSIVPTPNPGSPDARELIGVYCLKVTDCWAVGYQSTGNQFSPLFQHWNGKKWSIVG